MARNLPVTTIQHLCSPTWVAKTYSEYLLDCAQAQFSLVEHLTNAAASESLQNEIDRIEGVFNTYTQDIINIANDYCSIRTGDRPCVSLRDGVTSIALDGIVANRNLYPTLYSRLRSKFDQLMAVNSTYNTEILDCLNNAESFDYLFDEMTTDAFIQTTPDYLTARDSEVNSQISELNYSSNTPIILNEGVISVSDLFKMIIDDVNGLPMDEYSLSNISGTEILSNFSQNADQLFDQLKSAGSSAVAWAFGFASMTKNTVSDKIAYFNSQIGTFISDTTEAFASSVNVVKARIAEASDNIYSFFEIAADELGWNKFANDDLESVTDTDVYAYTGASPLSAIDTSTAIGVFQAIGKTILTIGYGIFQGAKTLITKGWNKIKPYVKAVTDDPVDIGVCNSSDDSYTISQWFFHRENVFIQIENDHNYDFFETDKTLESILASKINKWISIDTYFGELQFKIHGLNSHFANDQTVFSLDYRFKPKCINYRALINRGLVTKMFPVGTPTYNDKVVLSLFLPDSQSAPIWEGFVNSGELYPSDDEDEKYVYMGFLMAIGLFNQLATVTFNEVYQFTGSQSYGLYHWGIGDYCYVPQYDGTNVNLLQYTSPNFYYYTRQMVSEIDDWWTPASVSNLDFLKIASGYDSDNSVNRFDTYVHVPNNLTTIDNVKKDSLNKAAASLAISFILQQVDRAYYPSEYLYIPYYNNSYELSSGRYRIKTDAQNADVANTIANALLIVAVVLTVILVTKTVLKIRKQSRIAKLTQRVGEMDNKMWNGGKLSHVERTRYFRAKSRIAKLEGASSGLAGSGSIGSKLYKSIGQAQSLLVGQTTSDNDGIRIVSDSIARVLQAITGRDL